MLAVHRRDAGDLHRLVGQPLQRVGAGIVAGRRAAPAADPDGRRDVEVLDRPLVVMRLSANRACDSIELFSETLASSAPAAFACASTVSQILSASSRVSIRVPPC